MSPSEIRNDKQGVYITAVNTDFMFGKMIVVPIQLGGGQRFERAVTNVTRDEQSARRRERRNAHTRLGSMHI